MFSNSHKSPHLLLSIGSGSVAAVIVEHEGSKTVIRSACRVTLSDTERTPEQDASAIAAATEDCVGKVIASYAKKGKRAIHHVIVVIHPPWVRSYTSRAATALKAPLHVTAKMIQDLSARALAEKNPLDQKSIFERSILRVELNGYSTGKPVGKIADQLATVVIQSDIDPKLLTALKDALGRAVPGRTPKLRSSTFVIMSVLRRVYPDVMSYTLVDMTSEATGIASTVNGIIEQSVTVPTGSHGVVRALADVLKMTPETARSTLRMAMSETAAPRHHQEIKDALDTIDTTIIKGFGKGFSTIAQERRLPNTLITLSHPDVADWLSRFLGRLDFSQFTLTGRPFSVHAIDPTLLSALSEADPGLDVDAGQLLLAAFTSFDQTE